MVAEAHMHLYLYTVLDLQPAQLLANGTSLDTDSQATLLGER